MALPRTTPAKRAAARPAVSAPAAPGLTDLFAPSALAFDRGHLVLGSLVGRVLTLTDYPPRVGAAWLARLFQMPGVVGSLHLTPGDPSHLVRQITASISEFSARLAAGSRNALITQRTEQSLRDAQELLRQIDQEQQQVFTVTVVLLVLAADKTELDQRTKRIEAAASAAGLRAREATFLQWDGLTAAGPWAQLPAAVQEVAPRLLPSQTVSAAFPFVGGSINHGSGIVLGRDAEGGLVIVDRWAPPGGLGAEGPNMVVLARTRAGKTYAVKVMCLREYAMGASLILVDPEGEYRTLAARLGGVWVDVAGGGTVINPLQVRAVPRDSDGDAAPRGGRLSSPLAQHLHRTRTFFALYLPDLTDLELAVLEEAVLTVYQAAGVTWETDPAHVQHWPTMVDLYSYVRDQAARDPAKWDRLAVLLRPAAEGSDAELWVGAGAPPPEVADVLVLDVQNLHNLPDNVKRAQYFNVLGFTWDLVRRDWQRRRKMVVVDEAWFLCDRRVPAALDFLREMSKRIAKYGGALTTISQNAIDFLAPELELHGQAVLGNATYKFLLRQGEKDLEALTRLLSLSDAERDLLATARRGEGLLIAGNQRVRMQVEAASHELPLVDPRQAAALGIADEG